MLQLLPSVFRILLVVPLLYIILYVLRNQSSKETVSKKPDALYFRYGGLITILVLMGMMGNFSATVPALEPWVTMFERGLKLATLIYFGSLLTRAQLYRIMHGRFNPRMANWRIGWAAVNCLIVLVAATVLA